MHALIKYIFLNFYFKYCVNPVWDDISILVQERNNRLETSVADTNGLLDIVEKLNFIDHTGTLISPTFEPEYYGNYRELLRRLISLLPLSFILPGMRIYYDYNCIHTIYKLLSITIALDSVSFFSYSNFIFSFIYNNN
ncbi:MAG TPA: hypothetical protein VLB80_02920 [Candidatus Babeliales bacterium]|nr:hypothetical protein [Candidatus Babeliales bacterium]